MILTIVKYIAVYKSPKNFLRYIMNDDKTDKMKLVAELNCTENLDYAYNQMSNVFEKFAKERFCKKSLNNENCGKEKIRLHHYIQSFKPDEISLEEAHKIGVEWTRKVFVENHQVLVTTHVDKNHIHNHFAVSAYDLDGKKWYGNKTTLKRCRDISDKICKFHGLSVIENPTYKNNQKYSDWLARQQNVSWKTQFCDEIDKLVLREDIKTVNDLAERLREKYYAVTLKKYLSIRVSENRKASLDVAENEKSTAASNYKTYLQQMQSDYDFVLEKMRREQEEMKRAEHDVQHKPTIQRNNSYFGR